MQILAAVMMDSRFNLQRPRPGKVLGGVSLRSIHIWCRKAQLATRSRNSPIASLRRVGTCVYLQYKNDKASYVNAWCNVVDWDDVAKRFDKLPLDKYSEASIGLSIFFICIFWYYYQTTLSLLQIP